MIKVVSANCHAHLAHLNRQAQELVKVDYKHERFRKSRTTHPIFN